MADENYRSNRTGGAFARAAQPAYPGYATPAARSDQSSVQSPAPGDPLAELARLIGQNDPFADFGRPAAPRDPYPTAEAPQQPAYHPPAPAYAPDPGYPSNPAYTESPAFGAPNEPHYTDRYDQASFGHANAGHGQAYPPAQADAGYEPHYAATDAAAGTYQPDPFYRAEHAMPVASDDMYEEDAPPPRRRGGLGIVAGIVALALVGTGAAYGYRTLVSGSSGKSAPPPVIKADGLPNKVIPPSSGDSQTGKMTDRVGEPGQGERMVSREEKPVDIKDASRPGQPPRVIFPGPVANQGAQPSGTSALASAPSSPSAWAEPKKVRTEVIRPDRPDRPVTTDTTAQPPSNTRAAPPARTAAAAAPPPDSNGPLSLAPQNGQPQPAARTRTAAAPAAPSATPAAAPTGTGAYVQVSSRGSEADAQASFRALQTKFPSQLGGQSPVIRRADLGDKGVFFRALVGPYSTEQATTMCVNLKAAGGACVVQRN
jgi:hypothetical protein